MSKKEHYDLLLRQIEALLEGENDPIACMANVTAAIQEMFHFWWTGFYRVIEEELVLGPFQGPLACTRIPKGGGVCGTAWAEARTLIVADVHQFKGHIACSSASQSEIVVPIWHNESIVAVLDIDSEHLCTFNEEDQLGLEYIAKMIGKKF